MVIAGYKLDWSRLPATSIQARWSRFDVPTTVAAAGASTAWVWAMAAHASRDLAVFLVQQLVRLRGKFLGAAEVLRSGHGCSSRLAVRYRRDNQGTACVAALTAGIPYRGLTPCAVRR
jgi:hypothetical protein